MLLRARGQHGTEALPRQPEMRTGLQAASGASGEAREGVEGEPVPG